MESLHGWTLLGARGTGFVMFWGWESEEIFRRIDVEARIVSFLKFLSFNPIHLFFVWVFWSGTSSLVAVTAEDSFLYSSIRDAYNAKVDEGVEITEEGVEEAFEVVAEVSEVSLKLFLSPNK